MRTEIQSKQLLLKLQQFIPLHKSCLFMMTAQLKIKFTSIVFRSLPPHYLELWHFLRTKIHECWWFMRGVKKCLLQPDLHPASGKGCFRALQRDADRFSGLHSRLINGHQILQTQAWQPLRQRRYQPNQGCAQMSFRIKFLTQSRWPR